MSIAGCRYRYYWKICIRGSPKRLYGAGRWGEEPSPGGSSLGDGPLVSSKTSCWSFESQYPNPSPGVFQRGLYSGCCTPADASAAVRRARTRVISACASLAMREPESKKVSSQRFPGSFSSSNTELFPVVLAREAHRGGVEPFPMIRGKALRRQLRNGILSE